MFKRFMIGLVAVGLVVIFMTEAANALVFRGRNTVVNTHICNQFLPGTQIPDLCYGADSVSDRLTGLDGVEATCTMTGMLVCEQETGGICSDSTNEAPLTTNSFISINNLFDLKTNTAQDLTSLVSGDGQQLCNEQFPQETTVFTKFWPSAFLAYSVYEDKDTAFPNIGVDQTTYELIQRCTIEPGDELYSCTTVWDSSPTYADSPRPHLPCCGESNTLTVNVTEGGTVTSDPAGINCGTLGTDCNKTYNGSVAPYDGCPEVVLTATPDEGLSGYEFTGWSGGGGCSGTGTCTPSLEDSPTVTATFEASYHTLTVVVKGDGTKDRAWLFYPRSDFDDPAEFYCYGTCTKRFDPGTTVTIKRKGGTFGTWGDDPSDACYGVPNSSDTCTVTMDKSYTATANFIN
jgi:hypothetical protein